MVRFPSWSSGLPLCLAALAGAMWSAGQPSSVPALKGEWPAGRATASIHTWVLQFDPEVADECFEPYRDLLAATPENTHFVVAVTSDDDLEILRDGLGGDRLDSRMQAVEIGRRISAWARDRYVVVPRCDGVDILLPDPATVDSFRRPDLAVAKQLLARTTGARLVETDVAFEGGNILVADDVVLVGVSALAANVAQYPDPGRLVARLGELFDRRVIIVGNEAIECAHEHLDMTVALVGGRHVLVGSPRLAASYFDGREDVGIPDGAPTPSGTFDRGGNELWDAWYDSVADQLATEGFEVTRVPALHSIEGTLLTWTNAVVERRADQRHVYLPHYGIPVLDRAADETWIELGFAVHAVDCTQIIQHGGALRCLTNVLARSR